MVTPIIEIQNIGKRYRIGAAREPYLSLRDEVSKWLFSAARRSRSAEQEFWALEKVDFSVKPGEAVGVVGRNGAGKSTLLKILSQITPPTKGTITMRGRVGSLLEVGTGFHPELTGRENIYMNGAILGMTRREIARKFDEIVAFAEMEKFLDTPVKRYSSGMYVRLAFAVAAHLEPEILLVDEVLAVGDADFQKKCLGKMGDEARSGRTVLFVSHNMQAMKSLCQRAIWLQDGQIYLDAEARVVVQKYLAQATATDSAEKVWESNLAPGDETLRLRAVRAVDEDGRVRSEYENGSPVFIQIEFDLREPHSAWRIGFDLVSMDGHTVITSFHNDGTERQSPVLHSGRNLLQCEIPPGLLNAGTYGIAPRIGIHRVRWAVHEDPVVQFDVQLTHSGSAFWTQKRPGVLASIWHWRKLVDTSSEKGRTDDEPAYAT